MAPRPAGHLKEISRLKWRVKVLRGYENGDPTKPRYKQTTVYCTRADADRELARLLTEYGKPTDLHDTTVAQAFREWAEAHSAIWTTNQSATARSVGRKLEPIGHIRVDSLGIGDVERFRDQLLAKGSAPSYVKRIVGSLSTCYQWLIRRGAVATNPLASVRVPTSAKRVVPPSTEAVHDFLKAIRDRHPREHAALRLAAVTGARRGEIVGLQWSDVSGLVITFQRTVGADSARSVRQSLKAGHSKVLAIDQETLEALEAARTDTVWIFGDDGRPWRPDRLTSAFARLQMEFPRYVRHRSLGECSWEGVHDGHEEISRRVPA